MTLISSPHCAQPRPRQTACRRLRPLACSRNSTALDHRKRQSPEHGAEAYTYDPLGNRQSDASRPGPWQYNANNQLTQSFTRTGEAIAHAYDENGSLTQKTSPSPDPKDKQRFIYDASNRLVEVRDDNNQTVATYKYDPFGRRIEKTAGGNTTFFLYSDKGLIAEATPTGSLATLYGWKPEGIWGTDPLFIRTTKTNASSPEVFFYQNDHLGTPQKVHDAQGNVVWEAKAQAFGETTVSPTSTITNNLRFPGQYEDPETRTYYNFFRTYDFALGRYLQFDPIGLGGGINGYLYVGGNSLVSIDPQGLASQTPRYGRQCGRCWVEYDSDNQKGPHTHWYCPGQPKGCIKKDGSLCDNSLPPPPNVEACLKNWGRIPQSYGGAAKEMAPVCGDTCKKVIVVGIGVVCLGVCLTNPVCAAALGVGGVGLGLSTQ